MKPVEHLGVEAAVADPAAKPADRIALRRAFQFRLYPTPEQAATLSMWERSLRWLWNLANEQRVMAFHRPKGERPKVDYYSQGREMTQLLTEDPRLKLVLCSARQQVLRDLDLAWQRWRKKLGGRPHFKGGRHAVGFYVSTPAQWRVEAGALHLRGAAAVVGAIKIRQDRPWPDVCKFSSCRIKRDVDEWYAVFAIEETIDAPAVPTGAPIGLNRGAIVGIADSDGAMHDPPGAMRQSLGQIEKLSRSLARKTKGSANRRKAAIRLARVHQKVRRQREWWQHQLSKKYASEHAVIGVEDFNIKRMVQIEKKEENQEKDDLPRGVKAVVNRAILDVGWYEIARQIEYKAERYGSRVVKVEPMYISRICSECGCGATLPASGHKEWRCEACGVVLNGDVNAARNVLARALETPVAAPKERVKLRTPVRRKKTEEPQDA